MRKRKRTAFRWFGWRALILAGVLFLLTWLGYRLWTPGLDLQDGRHDRGRNGIWLSHGWLGGDEWFLRYGKTEEIPNYREPQAIRAKAELLRRHHITDLFPHLCPVRPDGSLPAVDSAQVERFLDFFEGFRVIPWIGGPNGSHVLLHREDWRAAFVEAVQDLLTAHPRLAGVQINVEPLPSGEAGFLALLDECRKGLPSGKIISVAAYPPPTWWHPYEEVHWDEAYFRKVAARSDQMVVMLYDAAQRIPKAYQRLMADWTEEVLDWSEGKAVLLGVPTYDDAGVGYHYPEVENLPHALRGIHRGLSTHPLPENYQGIAIYCEWETSDSEWQYLREHFLHRDTGG